MSAEHRRRGFWGVVTEDRYRKLVAIGLAVILWWFIDRRITDSWTVPMVLNVGDVEQLKAADRISNKLDVYLPAGGRVVGTDFFDGDKLIKNVNVTFSGPRFEIDGLRERERLHLEVVKFIDHAWRTSAAIADGSAGSEVDFEFVEFTTADIRETFQLDGVEIELSPARVRLKVEIRESVSVALTRENVRFDAGGSDRLRKEGAVFTPSHMEIVGPALTMSGLDFDNAEIFYVELSVDPDKTEVSAELQIIGGPKLGIYPVGDAARVTIPLEPDRKSRTLTLPVVINDLRANPTTFYEAEEKTVDVEVSFAGALAREVALKKPEEVQGWAANNFKLEVNITDDVVVETFTLKPLLIPNGLILNDRKYKHTDYRLHTSRIVRVRKKQ